MSYTISAPSFPSFYLPYPPELAEKIGSTGFMMSTRSFYEGLAKDNDDKHPARAAFFREVAGYYEDIYPDGEPVRRDTQANIVAEYDDWEELNIEQKLLRGNVNAAMAMVDRIRYELEMVEDDLAEADNVTRVRRELAEISL